MGPEPGRCFLSRAPHATERLAEVLGRALPPGSVVALSGELGSGKTTFVRGLARGRGISENVSSPTFTLMQEYEGGHGGPLYHFDAWMAGREELFLEGGAAAYMGGEGVACVEWAERVEAWLPRPHLRVVLEHRGPEERRLELELVGAGEGAGGAARTSEVGLAELLEGLPEALEGDLGEELALEVSPRSR